jgi:hypothetical protein
VAVVFRAAKDELLQCTAITPADTASLLGYVPTEPHATTLPLFFSAANARSVEYIETTPEFASVTVLGAVPPLLEFPHATTLPSLFSAANAPRVEYIVTTPEFAAVTLLGAAVPPKVDPHATTLPSLFKAAKAAVPE